MQVALCYHTYLSLFTSIYFATSLVKLQDLSNKNWKVKSNICASGLRDRAKPDHVTVRRRRQYRLDEGRSNVLSKLCGCMLSNRNPKATITRQPSIGIWPWRLTSEHKPAVEFACQLYQSTASYSFTQTSTATKAETCFLKEALVAFAQNYLCEPKQATIFFKKTHTRTLAHTMSVCD